MGTSVIALSYLYIQQSFNLSVRKCLGIALLCGSLTPVGDMVITKGLEDVVGKKPISVHVARSLTWITAGVWCLV